MEPPFSQGIISSPLVGIRRHAWWWSSETRGHTGHTRRWLKSWGRTKARRHTGRRMSKTWWRKALRSIVTTNTGRGPCRHTSGSGRGGKWSPGSGRGAVAAGHGRGTVRSGRHWCGWCDRSSDLRSHELRG